MMTTRDHTAAVEAEELPPDSQFESFYDKKSGEWSLRLIPSSPPLQAADPANDDAPEVVDSDACATEAKTAAS